MTGGEIRGLADEMRLHQQERAILEVTELICRLMEEQKVSRADLAKCLDRPEGYITRLLDGRASMTVQVISDVFVALGHVVHFRVGRLGNAADSVCKS